jgi:hypothetical protein
MRAVDALAANKLFIHDFASTIRERFIMEQAEG